MPGSPMHACRNWIAFISLLFFVLNCSKKNSEIINNNIASQNLSEKCGGVEISTTETHSAQLAQMWQGLLSNKQDLRIKAFELISGNPAIAMNQVRAQVRWIGNSHLAIAFDATVLDIDAWRSDQLWQNDIPALANSFPPFSNWDHDKSAQTLSSLYVCAFNLRKFSQALELAQIPKAHTLQPSTLALLTLQLDICIKTSAIRESILHCAESAHVPGFEPETLLDLRGALENDRRTDSEMLGKLLQARKNWAEDLQRMIQHEH